MSRTTTDRPGGRFARRGRLEAKDPAGAFGPHQIGLRHGGRRAGEDTCHAAEDIGFGRPLLGSRIDRPRYSLSDADPQEPPRRLGARPRPGLVGPHAGHRRGAGPADRTDHEGRHDRELLRLRAGRDDGCGRDPRRDAPGRPVLLDRHDPPGARADRRRLAGARGRAALGRRRRLGRPVPRLRRTIYPDEAALLAARADGGRGGGRRSSAGPTSSSSPLGLDRDLAQPDHRQHVPPDPPSRRVRGARRRRSTD